MSKRFLIILGAFILIIGGAIAVILFVYKSPSAQNAIYSITNRSDVNTNTTNTTTNTNRTTLSPDSEAIRFTARTFAERYGSFSNQSDGSNLRSAAEYATPSYAETLKTRAASTQPDYSSTYHGVTSKAIAFDVVSQTTNNSTIVVSVQQTVIDGATTSTITKELQLDEVKTDDGWRVNAATWQ